MTTTEAQAQPRRYRQAVAPLQASVSALALNRRDWLGSLLVFVLAALLLLAADVALLRLHPGAYTIPVGNYRDKFFLERANYQETAPDGKTYRWTTADSTLRLNQVGVARHAFLTLDLGGRPAADQLRLTLNEQPWASLTATTQPRHLMLLLPPDLPQELAIGLHSPTFTVAGDSRKLGVKVEGFTLTLARDAAPFPTPSQYLAQAVIMLAAQAAAVRLGWRGRAQALLALPLALALAALLSSELLLTYAYLPRLMIAALGLAALTWLALPLAERLATTDHQPPTTDNKPRIEDRGSRIESRPPAMATAATVGIAISAPRARSYEDVREIRLLWALMLGACALRLAGVLYPTFGGQDLGLNLGRLFKTITGQMVVIAGSSEFANGLTIYPPGPYLVTLPGAVATSDYGSLLQAVQATLDGATAFLIALVARRLGGSRDAGRFALLLYAGSIPAIAALQFGFSAQIIGQWFTAPLLLLLLASKRPPQPRTWLLATLLLLLGIFSHIGVAILGVTWMGFALLLTLPHDRRSALWGISLMAAGGLLALGLLYVDIAAITLSHASGTLADRAGGGLRGATELLVKGALLAYSEIGLALLPLGLLLIGWRSMGWGRQVAPLALLLTALLFFVVDVTLAMQVRYFYFALPLALPAIAIVLGRIASRGSWGRWAAWALVLALLLQGVIAWFIAAFGDAQISMTPLTH
jgi:hypothetical protein